jgi:hypothetical protein
MTATGRRRAVLVTLAAVLLAVTVAVLVTRRSEVEGTAAPGAASTPAAGSVVPAGDLAGEWSGQGALTRCAGFDGCSRTRPVTLTIDCPGGACAVTPFDASYGSPPLVVADGGYRATGPLPGAVAPTCDGDPSSSGRWLLELTVRDGRLVGSYAESTLQSFSCGGTGVAWDVALDRG